MPLTAATHTGFTGAPPCLHCAEAIAVYAGIVAIGEWAVRCDEQHVLDAYCGGEDFDGSPDPCPTCGALSWEPCAPGCSEAPYRDN